jgi:hypothetical protein
MTGTKLPFGARITSLAKSLIALEREKNGGSDADALERLIYRGSNSPEAHKLVLEEATKDPQFAALIPAIRKAKWSFDMRHENTIANISVISFISVYFNNIHIFPFTIIVSKNATSLVSQGSILRQIFLNKVIGKLLTGMVVLTSILPGGLHAQQLVTNWVAAGPTVKQFGINIYDTAKWPSIEVPQYLTYSIDGKPYDGSPKTPLTIIGRLRTQLNGQWFQITFNNFSYDPKAFAFENGGYAMRPAFPMYVKALMTDCRTNFSAEGKIVDISRTFDCGLPVTNLIPVVRKIKPKAVSEVATNMATAKWVEYFL